MYVPCMDMQSPSELQAKIEERLRTIRILWAALFLSNGVYYVFTRFAEQPKNPTPDSTISLALLVIALSTIPVSLVFKKRALALSVQHQRIEIVQQAYIVACAINEAAALLGLVDFYVTGDRYYFALMIIAAFGQLLNFPRRQHLLDASFKSPTM